MIKGKKILRKQRRNPKYKKRSPFVLLLLIIILSLVLGWGMELAIGASNFPNPDLHSWEGNLKSVDSVPRKFKLGKSLYLENCSSCHIPIPPEVLPTETWREILKKPHQHYGKKLPELISVTKLLIWDYLRTFSRPLAPQEVIPIYVQQSRYFKALHPRVKLPKYVTHQSCVTCHPAAAQFDYRRLTPEWENSP